MLTISAFESELLDLRIARCDLDYLDEATIEQMRYSALEQNIDVIRLKLDASVNAQQYLKDLSLPHSFSGGISEYIVTRDNYDFSNCKQKIEFIEIKEEAIGLFKDFFYQTFSEHDIGYHNAPYLSGIINKKDELDCLYLFYAGFIKKEKHKLIFLKKESELVGFSTIQITEENTLLLPITGILPKYRSKGLYYEVCESYLSYFYENKLPACIFSSRNENKLARQVYSSFAFKHHSSKYNYNITPLLNKKSTSDTFQLRNITFKGVENIISIIIDKIKTTTYRTLRLKECITHFDKSFDNHAMYDIDISQAFQSEKATLYVCKIKENDSVKSVFWLEYEYC